MDFAQEGEKVIIHYSLRDTKGNILDSTEGKDPASFTLGSFGTMPFLNRLIKGMSIGEIKTVTLKAKEAYGEKLPELISDIDIKLVPAHIKKVVGQKIEIQQEDRPPLQATITNVTGTHITIDSNPDLLGKDIVVKIELLDIQEQ
jgi:peptidylprolyl isomerase